MVRSDANIVLLFENFDKISPYPAVFAFLLGVVVQYINPCTQLNLENMSISTMKIGAVFGSLLILVTIIFHNKYISLLAGKFMEMFFTVCGFSAAYFFTHDNLKLAIFLFFTVFIAALVCGHLLLFANNEFKGTMAFCKLNVEWKGLDKAICRAIAIVALTFTVAFLFNVYESSCEDYASAIIPQLNLDVRS